MRPLHPVLAPVEVVGRRGGEQYEQPRGICAVDLDDLVGVDHVAERLGHLRPVLDHHPLSEEVGEGLARPREPQVREELGEEARVNQVETGVLDAAYVLVHWHPVVGLVGVEGDGVVVS